MMEKLKKHKESNPFKVPEDYFAGLNDRIIANSSESNGPDVRRGLFSIKPFLTLAAVISGAALITLAVLNTIPSAREQKVTVAEIFQDADDYAYNEIDLYIIESAFIDMTVPVEPGHDFSDDEIIDFLLTDQVDLSLLYEHLGEGFEL